MTTTTQTAPFAAHLLEVTGPNGLGFEAASQWLAAQFGPLSPNGNRLKAFAFLRGLKEAAEKAAKKQAAAERRARLIEAAAREEAPASSPVQPHARLTEIESGLRERKLAQAAWRARVEALRAADAARVAAEKAATEKAARIGHYTAKRGRGGKRAA